MRKQLPFILVLVFVCFFVFYLKFPDLKGNFFSTFLSVSTFLFAIFTGFFISRQGKRYNAMRDAISDFDGEVSSIYRVADMLPKKKNDEIKGIIKKEYRKMGNDTHWEYSFLKKTSFMTDLMSVPSSMHKHNLDQVSITGIRRIAASLNEMQVIRKKIIVLGKERIPKVQWALIISLALIIIVLIASVNYHLIIFTTILKTLFSTIVVLVLLILYQFDQLVFYEDEIGKTTAEDVLEIINKKK
jgi:hypothetical protein